MILNDQGGLKKIRLDNAFGNIEISGKLKGNIYENLVGGTNITLSELNGITTINSSASASSDGNVITSPPPLYAFSVTSNFNGNRVYNNAVLELNTISYDGYFVKPFIDAYNFNTYQYTVPIDGVWNIGVRIYVQDGATANLRLGLYKNGTFLTLSGRYAGHAESIDILTELVKNDVLEVRTWSDTTNTIAMTPKFSYFYGHLVSNTGTSNAVSSETDLTVKSLNIGDVNIGEKLLSLENIISSNPTYAFSVTSSLEVPRTYNNSIVEFNSISAVGSFLTPTTAISAFNFSIYRYTIPVSGYWNIGARVYVQDPTTENRQVAIFKNGAWIAVSGRYSGHSESIETL